jgi:type I restriction enzyme, S subunit
MSNKTKTTATKEEAKPALVPKLRFPEFRSAEAWASEPMDEVYFFKGNNSLPRDKLNYVAGSVKNIHYGDIHTKFSTHFDITKELVPFINESVKDIVRDENLCAEGDMIFADASEDMADIGKSIEIVSLNGEHVASGLHTILARRIGDRIALGFGGHLFKSGWVRAQIQKEAQGAKVLGISATRMRSLCLPLPHAKGEQQKIAECLSSADELMAAQARKVDALKTHKKGLMQQLFPREGEAQPRLRLPEFQKAGDWAAAPMGTLLIGSPDYGVNAAAVPFSEHLPRYLRITDISEDGRYLREKQVSVDLEATDESYLDEGDIVLARTGASVGKSYQYRKEDGRLVFAGFLIRVKPHPRKLVSTYLANFLTTGQFWKWVAVNSARSGQPGINSSEFSSMTIPLPPTLTEQQRIASCLSSLDALVTAETQKHEALKTHKKGLMQQLFPSPEGVEA